MYKRKKNVQVNIFKGIFCRKEAIKEKDLISYNFKMLFRKNNQVNYKIFQNIISLNACNNKTLFNNIGSIKNMYFKLNFK